MKETINNLLWAAGFAVVIVLLILSYFALYHYSNPKKDIEFVPVRLTQTDTIYKQLDSIQIKSDTIKLYYDKKIKDYRILPTPERVRLFAERINR